MQEITKTQVEYMEDKLADAIACYPDSILVWLNCYRETVELRKELEIMGPQLLTEKGFDNYVSTIHWMKDHWPTQKDSEPETLCMIDIEV